MSRIYKIYILFDIKEEPWGGGNQFLRLLREELVRLGIYTNKAKEADIIIFNSHHKLIKALSYKLLFKNKFFVHRVDGPISLIRGDNLKLDKKIFYFNELLSDLTIFQSNYSFNKTAELNLYNNKSYKVILNGSCDKTFKNESRKIGWNSKFKIIISSWSNNFNKGFDCYKWIDENLDFNMYQVTFIGNSPIKFKNILKVNPQSSHQLSEFYKKSHLYLTASKHDTCSNSLIEAIISGLPALAFNDGGHPEIIKSHGLTFNNFNEIPAKLNEIKNNYDQFIMGTDKLTIKYVCKEYVENFKSFFEEFNETKKLTLLKYIKVLIYVFFNYFESKFNQSI